VVTVAISCAVSEQLVITSANAAARFMLAAQTVIARCDRLRRGASVHAGLARAAVRHYWESAQVPAPT